MDNSVPIRDLKNTSAFAKRVQESTSPVPVTRNGVNAFYAISNDYYEAIELDRAKLRLYERMERAEREYQDGRYSDGAAFTQVLREKYGL